MPIVDLINYVDWLQFLGAVTGILGSWHVTKLSALIRFRGYCLYVLSNLFFIAWSISNGLPWVLVMNLCFAYTTALGLWTNRPRKGII